jgi:hypothetical protein
MPDLKRRGGRRRRAALTVALLALGSNAMAQDSGRRAESAGIPVRFVEGAVHGFLELRTATGALAAHGDLLQKVHDGQIESRMVFHFPDSSFFEETVTFSQQGVFTMEHYHLTQGGSAFDNDLDVTLSRSGEYQVKTRSHKDGEKKEYSGKLELPPDVYNGMVITIAKNLGARDTQTVHIVAFTPEPRLIGLEILPTGSQPVMLGQHVETAVHFKLKPKLGLLVKIFATVLGKAPPDSDTWIVTDDVPAFVRFEGPLYSGPVWHLGLTSPSWAP